MSLEDYRFRKGEALPEVRVLESRDLLFWVPFRVRVILKHDAILAANYSAHFGVTINRSSKDAMHGPGT